jgi:hypothetical protein
MKRSYVQCAEVLLEPDADPAAPGGAVTLALCGSWEHAGACRWPHETVVRWEGRRGWVRVVLVAAVKEEQDVRTLIDRALAGGVCPGPEGKPSRWQAMEYGAGVLSESEEAWGTGFGGRASAEDRG